MNSKQIFVGFCVVLFFALCECQRMGDQLMGRHFFPDILPDEEIYPYDSQERYYQPEGYYPEQQPYRNIHPHFPMSRSLYQPMPIGRPGPDIIAFDSMMSPVMAAHEEDVPFFQPQVRAGAFDNPFTKMMDPMRKQMSDSIKQAGDSMGKQAEDAQKQFGEAGEKMTEMVQKPAEDFAKQMQGAMEDAKSGHDEIVDTFRDGAEDAMTGIPFAPTSGNITDSKKKAESKTGNKTGDVPKQMADAKKNMEDTASSSMKKMQEAGNNMKKNFPIPGSLVSGIKDETTEVHEDEVDFPRAEAMEWGRPDFVDVRYHPRSRYFDYYDDGTY